MSRTSGQPFFNQIGGGDCPGGDEDLEFRPRLQQTFDEPENCRCFTDAGCVNPDQRPAWPRLAGDALALAEAYRVLLAPIAPTLQISGAKGRVSARYKTGSITRLP